ncbi:hypothetical protein VB264_05310 [Arcicella aquatica]|uniref:Uncharacterized protein n=1 Tax=Arcicella aquatica TaxID=217141 RepID=A0ABU5QJT4_9BACT|nr:hypothetical protein [Arcicella aquatica]MEA5257195.1 hypothetical protein [Arcicella aquatica]
MEIKFQKVRELIAGLVGSPTLTEKMASDIDSAIKADEAAASQLLASAGTGTVPTGTPPAGTAPGAGTPPVVGTLPATGAVATTEEPVTLEKLMGIMTAMDGKINGIQAENTRLTQENQELKEFKASQSPTNMAVNTENNGAAGAPVRISKTAEKDAKALEELNRLAALYPSLMGDLV